MEGIFRSRWRNRTREVYHRDNVHSLIQWISHDMLEENPGECSNEHASKEAASRKGSKQTLCGEVIVNKHLSCQSSGQISPFPY
jgi:hypothetical protein